ncbi:MAG TPA: class I SAM-dependent methyltransferase [Burkholderiales bacterium]|nr:class I SAM-dependent methyltransferase [Burkholderiales bacterium]
MDKDPQLAQAALEAGAAAFYAGDHAAAAEHFARALRADPERPEAHHFAGGVAFQAGRYREALERFEHACRLAPDQPLCYFDLAATFWKLGDSEAARRYCEKTLALAPDLDPAHQFLAALNFPGPIYLDLLPMIHSHLRPRTYMEIGVSTGDSLALVRPETRAIGVDPDPKVTRSLGARTSIRAITSDDYFATYDVAADLEGLPVDLAFIDGMHQFEFALRDFINIEKHCAGHSTILVHDVYPLTRLTAERERKTIFWSGDIWRLILILRKYRPELVVSVIAAAPTGLAVVRGLDPGSRLLSDRYEEIVREYLALDYSALDAGKAEMLALYPNDWEKIRTLLD